MKGKSILALAVALAMIFSVIPAFGLTASAAVNDEIMVGNTMYKIVGENLVENGGFDDGAGNFAWGTWESPNGSNGSFASKCEDWFYKVNRETGEAVLYQTGGELEAEDYALGTRWNDGSTALCSLANFIAVEANKTYHVSFDYKHVNDNVDTGYIITSFKADKNDYDDGSTTAAKIPSATKEWQTASFTMTTTEAGYIYFHFRWLGGENNPGNGPYWYFDNFVVEEVEKLESDASATVEYVDESGSVLKSIEYSDLYSGKEFKHTPEAWIANADFTAYYTVDDASEKTIVLKKDEEGENKITVNYTKAQFDSADIPEVVRVDDKFYTVKGENLVPNPSFETVDGEYSLLGWYGATGGTPNTNAYPEAHQFPAEDAMVGTYSFGSKYGDEKDGLCSILTNFKVEANKKYYFAYDVKYAYSTDPNKEASVSIGVADGAQAKATAPVVENISAVGNEWTRKSAIIDVGEAANPYISFNAYSIGNNSNFGGDDAGAAKFLFDNIKLVEVEENADMTVKVSYTAQDETVKTIENATAEDVNKIYNAGNHSFIRDDKNELYYLTSLKKTDTFNFANTGSELTIEVEKTGDIFTVQNGKMYTAKVTDDGVYTGTNSFAALNWGQEGTVDRFGVAVFDVTDTEKPHYALDGKQVRRYGDVTVKYYALSFDEYSAIDMNDAEALKAKLTGEIATRNSGDAGEIPYQIELNAESVKAAAGSSNKVVILMNANGGIFGIAKEGLQLVAGYTVTVDEGTPIVVAPGENEIAAAGVALKDADGKLYPVKDGKATIDVESDMKLTSVENLGVSLVEGAQVRIGKSSGGTIAEDSGLRFIGTTKADEGSIAGEEGAQIFVRIAPADAPENSVDIEITSYQSGDKADGIFTAVLTNLNTSNYNRVFTAAPVVKLGGEEYTGAPVSRSIYEVAAGILVEGTADTTAGLSDYTIVAEVLNAYVNAVGVRFNWDKDSNTIKDEETSANYHYGNKDGKKPVFFTVTSENGDADGSYKITVTPQGNETVIDAETFESTVRINNTNTGLKGLISGISATEDGKGVTFTFTPQAAPAE